KQLVERPVVVLADAAGVGQLPPRRRHPDGFVTLLEVHGQLPVRHQVEGADLHLIPSVGGLFRPVHGHASAISYRSLLLMTWQIRRKTGGLRLRQCYAPDATRALQLLLDVCPRCGLASRPLSDPPQLGTASEPCGASRQWEQRVVGRIRQSLPLGYDEAWSRAPPRSAPSCRRSPLPTGTKAVRAL